jgi:4-hydroxy-2-oxoheptanedioate aldolase
MPLRLSLSSETAAAGMWVCSGSPLVAEICAGSGLDWLLIDMEHAPNGLESVLAQLQAIAAYPIAPMVRVPVNDPVVIKRVLDLGASNLLVPMVESAAEAVVAVRSAAYPPSGVRGVGSALSRSGRWGRLTGYLHDPGVSVFVQIESALAVSRVEEIMSAGVAGVLVGPSDLAASMGHLGSQEHPSVVAAVEECIAAGRRLGVPVGVNAFNPVMARRYIDAGVSFILLGADVTLLAQGSSSLLERARS